MLYFTAYPHFGGHLSLKQNFRPYTSPLEFAEMCLSVWNSQLTVADTVYYLGDFFNYNLKETENWRVGFTVAENVIANQVLILGNNEERLINSEFGGSLVKFKDECLKHGFLDVVPDATIDIRGRKAFLNHYPSRAQLGVLNLFGHTHRTTGIWKPFGFNMFLYLKNYRLFNKDNLCMNL